MLSTEVEKRSPSIEEQREYMRTFLLGTVKVVLAILSIKVLRLFFLNEGADHPEIKREILVQLLGDQGTLFVQTMAITVILSGLCLITVEVLIYRWTILKKKVFWFMYYVVLDAVFLYFFPEFGQAFISALLK
jgi:hypothetical protein